VAALSQPDPQVLYPDDDPIVHRLRTMSWAHAPVDARDRCWEVLCERIDALEANPPPPRPIPLRPKNRQRQSDERYQFTRVIAPRRLAAAQAWHRPAHGVALAG
jgi:hypothetical protein